MARTAKRLSGPTQLTTSAVTQYTVPASTKTVIRHIHFENGTASAATVTVSLGADAAATRLYDAFSIGANQTHDFYTFVVIDAAEVIQAKAGTATAIVMTMSGEEITLG